MASFQDVLNWVYNSVSGALKTSPVAPDGNPSEFSYAVVGAHSSGVDISSKVTLTKPAGATAIILQTITQNARYTLDGTDPTTTVGFRLTAGNEPLVVPVPGSAIEIIQEAATASLQYQWVK
jgi:hypothetical protein